METTLVYFTISEIKIRGARHILSEAGIESFIVNKTDSVYAGILGGKIELYVRSDQQEEAARLLKESEILD